MTDSEKLENLRLDVARLEGKIDAFAQFQALDRADIKKIEGRVWAVVIGVGAAFGTSILSLVMSKSSPRLAQVASDVLTAFVQ